MPDIFLAGTKANVTDFKIALLQPPTVTDWERTWIPRITQLINGHQSGVFQLVDDPALADLVVLLESCTPKSRQSIAYYDSLPFLNDAAKLVCINYEDTPPGFLPGLYTSLERFRFDPSLHLSWPHLQLPNDLIDDLGETGTPDDHSHLFSFAGSCSHPLRRKLFDRFAGDERRWSVKEIKRWYNHDESEKRDYVNQILNSRFVLCPRGIASYSHRIIETLALGRVPVIVADDWVPFSIPEANYYIRIRESDVNDIAEMLQEHLVRYDEHRRDACSVYKNYFKKDIRYSVAAGKLVEFYRTHSANWSLDSLKKRWHSSRFWRMNGWSWDQRVRKRLKRGVQRLSSWLGASSRT